MKSKRLELDFCKLGPVQVRVHAGVVVLLAGAAWLAIDCHFAELDAALFLGGVLASVILHTFAHIVTALLLGGRPRRAIVMPYGDRLFHLPSEMGSLKKAAVIISGPATNTLIAYLLFPFLTHFPLAYSLEIGSIYEGLFLFNGFLVVINLFPVAPFDGWRLITLITGKGEVAVDRLYNVNQILLTLVFLAGFALEAPLLSLIALLVYVQCIKTRFKDLALQAAKNYKASEIMTPLESLQTFSHGMSVGDARIIAMKSVQSHFPVVSGTSFKGLVKRGTMRQVDSEEDSQTTVNEIIDETLSSIRDNKTIDILLQEGSEFHYPLTVLNEHDECVGIITHEQFMEWITFHLSEAKNDSSSNSDHNASKDKEEDTP